MLNFRLICLHFVWCIGACQSGSTPSSESSDPGTVTLHRLNRAELNNTWRDLLGTSLTPATEFPSDDLALGFDNIADSLSTSPLHFEMLESATDLMLNNDVLPQFITPIHLIGETESDAGDIQATTGSVCCGASAWNLWSNGQLEYSFTLEDGGDYVFRARVWGQQAGPDLVHVVLGLDGLPVQEFDIEAASADDSEVIEFTQTVSPGNHAFYIEFTNDYYQAEPREDRNLIIDYLEVSGPTDAIEGNPPNYDRLFTCDETTQGEATCVEDIIRTFGQKAWRRPLTSTEVERLVMLHQSFTDNGGTYHEGIGLVAKALMLSPHFFYRVEIDEDPNSSESHPLSSWELATRLSYFLWSSMPDDELFETASDNSLLDEDVLAEQVQRMLGDNKATALVDNLAGQWLQTRAMDDVSPDVWSFPEWDEDLRVAMKEEMRRMATHIFLEDQSMLTLLTAEETELNGRLASHYGLGSDKTADWSTYDLTNTERMGWLTTGGLLTLTSYPTRTSPVRRGKWVLSNVLCEAPAPPPDNVDAVLENEEAEEGESLVDQLARHRADPICASCHQSMDPIGLGFENFDGTGRWRDVDEVGQTIEAAGELTDGFSFSTSRQLAEHIAEDPKLVRCMAMKTLTYGLGRAPKVSDWPYLEQIEDDFEAGGHRFSDLVLSIVTSDPFRTRRGEEESP